MTTALTNSEPKGSFLTVQQVAERLQVSERTVRGWIGSGVLPSYKFGGSRRIGNGALEQFEQSRLENGGQR